MVSSERFFWGIECTRAMTLGKLSTFDTQSLAWNGRAPIHEWPCLIMLIHCFREWVLLLYILYSPQKKKKLTPPHPPPTPSPKIVFLFDTDCLLMLQRWCSCPGWRRFHGHLHCCAGGAEDCTDPWWSRSWRQRGHQGTWQVRNGAVLQISLLVVASFMCTLIMKWTLGEGFGLGIRLWW